MVGNAESDRGHRPAGVVAAGEPPPGAPVEDKAGGLPAARIGLVAGAVGMLCCLGPTVLALVGAVGAATAYTWANDLYNGYNWWFRLGGLVVAAGLVVWALRRRNACNLGGARAARSKIVLTLAVAVVTYAAIYGLTTWAGTFAQ